jgi:hypothetical protein
MAVLEAATNHGHKLEGYLNYRAAGNRRELPVALNNLANFELGLGDLNSTENYLLEARSTGDHQMRSVIVLFLAVASSRLQ